MRRDVPYAIMVPIVVVGFALVLMIWAMSGSGGRFDSQGPVATTGSALSRPTENAIWTPAAPGNDTAGDSVRATKALENNSR